MEAFGLDGPGVFGLVPAAAVDCPAEVFGTVDPAVFGLDAGVLGLCGTVFNSSAFDLVELGAGVFGLDAAGVFGLDAAGVFGLDTPVDLYLGVLGFFEEDMLGPGVLGRVTLLLGTLGPAAAPVFVLTV